MKKWIFVLALSFGFCSGAFATDADTEKLLSCFIASSKSADEKATCVATEAQADQKFEVFNLSKACFSKSDVPEQLKCIQGGLAALDETVSTKQAETVFAAGDFRQVDPEDLQLGPNKFMHKPIELRNMQCFYADLNEYRCWARKGLMTVFAPRVATYPEKEKFDDFCGRKKNVDSASCRKTLHIVPNEWREDQPSAFGKRTIILTDQLLFVQTKKN